MAEKQMRNEFLAVMGVERGESRESILFITLTIKVSC